MQGALSLEVGGQASPHPLPHSAACGGPCAAHGEASLSPDPLPLQATPAGLGVWRELTVRECRSRRTLLAGAGGTGTDHSGIPKVTQQGCALMEGLPALPPTAPTWHTNHPCLEGVGGQTQCQSQPVVTGAASCVRTGPRCRPRLPGKGCVHGTPVPVLLKGPHWCVSPRTGPPGPQGTVQGGAPGEVTVRGPRQTLMATAASEPQLAPADDGEHGLRAPLGPCHPQGSRSFQRLPGYHRQELGVQGWSLSPSWEGSHPREVCPGPAAFWEPAEGGWGLGQTLSGSHHDTVLGALQPRRPQRPPHTLLTQTRADQSTDGPGPPTLTF